MVDRRRHCVRRIRRIDTNCICDYTGYNGSAYIGKAIESALLQGVPLEIIVIDDGSTDNLDDVLKKYADTDVIRVIHNKHNIGVARSRNRGVRAAKGEYIAFLDCDDWWEPGKLKAQLHLMKKTGCVLCATGRKLVTPDGHSTEKFIRVKEHLTYRDLLDSEIRLIVHPWLFVRMWQLNFRWYMMSAMKITLCGFRY